MRFINTLSLMWMLVKYSDGTWKSGNTRANKSYETGFVLLNSIAYIKKSPTAFILPMS